jgi:hypothetical protein
LPFALPLLLLGARPLKSRSPVESSRCRLSRSLLKTGESGSNVETLRNPLLRVNGIFVLTAQGNDES